MVFRVVTDGNLIGQPGDVLLQQSDWNDWFTWHTLFHVKVIQLDGSHIHVGGVKIACAGMTPANAHTTLPLEFALLPNTWFSIGQSENYYETLNELGEEYRTYFLSSLQDGAYDLTILNRHHNEAVLTNSLLRSIDMERVRNRFHRLAHGNPSLTPFAFKYIFPPSDQPENQPLELSFRVTPNSKPPSNVHVLIGRNGVGKTRCFDLLSRSFLGLTTVDGNSSGSIEPLNRTMFLTPRHQFAGLVTVSFSPFDSHGPLVHENDTRINIRYDYVGLIREIARPVPNESTVGPYPEPEQEHHTIKSRSELSQDFVLSVAACREGVRARRWARALNALEADPLFADANVSILADENVEDWREQASRLFRKLSSGHSVVLLTITKLVELVEEKTLVLIDEPEGHLHPPLLSAFIRALSDLLIDRNGVAIIATHSPVVLQEVPKECVWIMNRSGRNVDFDRPPIETFGEHVGTLTREVFNLEVMQTGFHRMISEAVNGSSYEETLELFGDRLGAEALGLVRVLSLANLNLQNEVDNDEDET
ncbi:MAG: ATP-binding protein [Methylotenera sp.]|nr:ATP-binding protein [Methylotenera sp.]